DGVVQGATGTLTDATPVEDSEFTLTEAEAIDVATKVVNGTVVTSEAEARWVQEGPGLVAAWAVEVLTEAPLADWSIVVDASRGMVLRAEQAAASRRASAPGLRSDTAASGATKSPSRGQTRPRCRLPSAPAACVFMVDPIYAAGGELADHSKANDHLTAVRLKGLDDEDAGALVGEFANLEPRGVDPVRRPDGRWGAGRGDRGFEAQNVYYWIDYGQRTVQRLGFDDIRNESFPVVALDPENLDNAYFSPTDQMIFMGTGTNGGINEGEDASGVLHEYGHALLDDMKPRLKGGDTRAYDEGFGDLFAYLTTLELRNGDECLFLWTDEECLRRLDTNLVYPTDLEGEIHHDGQIYTGAIYDILTELLSAEGIDIARCPGTDDCNAARDRVLTTVLASNDYLTSRMSLADIAATYLRANEAMYDGADDDLIRETFADHGLAEGSGTVVDPDGNTNGTKPAVTASVEIAHPYRGDLRVVVGVADAAGNELCDARTLLEPSLFDSSNDLSTQVNLSDSSCAAFAPPTPDQQWYVSVEDTARDDEGKVVAFTIEVDGTPFRARGLPVPIADDDPTGTRVVIDGSDEASARARELPAVTDGVPSMSLSIRHGYHGDLSIRAGVADATGAILCSVTVREPLASDSASGSLDSDIALEDCAGHYPPTPNRRWFVSAVDNAADDEGTIERFSFTGPDGTEFEFTDLPVVVPDADVDGVSLLLDGATGSQGTVGGNGQTSETALPTVSLDITHPFAGDLLVTGGVVDADGGSLCEVVLHAADPSDDGDNLSGDASLSECVEHYPPSPDRQWFVHVVDTMSEDAGAIDSLVLTGPDGVIYTVPGAPIEIPDADVDGVALMLDGSEVGVAGDELLASVIVSHPYVGDLDVLVGVTDANGTVLCEVRAVTADPERADIDLALVVPMGACELHYPPAPDQQWFARVVDGFEFDTGTLDAFLLFGPDGAVYTHADAPASIPDADPAGVTRTVAPT
ncbi:MAG: M36 family metallopeptidase, partial [Acidimicrobiales bacterium]